MTESVYFGISSLDLVQQIDLQPQGEYSHRSPDKSLLVLATGSLKSSMGARSGDRHGPFLYEKPPKSRKFISFFNV